MRIMFVPYFNDENFALKGLKKEQSDISVILVSVQEYSEIRESPLL